MLRTSLPGHRSWWHYVGAVLTVGGATAAMVAGRTYFDILDVALLYLLLCMGFGLVAGSRPAAVVAVLSFLALNFFFVPPYRTLAVDQEHHELALVAFLGAALVTGQLVARVRDRTDAALREQRRTTLLYELNAALVGDANLDDVLHAIVERVVSVYGASRCRILLSSDRNRLRMAAKYPSHVTADIERASIAVAEWVIEHRAPAGRRTTSRILPPRQVANHPRLTLSQDGPDALYLPIATVERVVGVLEVVGKRGSGRLGEEDERLLTNFADQAALALERARLLEEADRSAELARSDELKSALLAAVSHDLRTPLATIKTSVTSLLDSAVDWDDAARAEFLHAIDEETDRLTLLVDNLLDLSKIEGGVLRPERAWYDVAELVADVGNRLAGPAAGHQFTTEVAPDLPLARFDYVQIRQVLLNLGENAVKYTPLGTRITVWARWRCGAIELAVNDDGPGIPPHKLPLIFNKFYRGDPSGRVAGTGIGLTISKGLVEANGGRIWAESREGEGTTLRFALPLEPAAEQSA